MTSVKLINKVENKIKWWRGKLEKRFYSTGLFSAEGLPLPDFLGIGAQKAGTTWLYENLRCHPDLFLPDKKELHYFDWNFHEPLSSYSQHFEPAGECLKGEITPGYSILSIDRIRFIRSINPDVRLLFLVRNPVERAWSQAKMNLVSLRDRDFEDVPDHEFIEHFQADRSKKRSDYETILRNWLSVFPREQMYIGSFEDISDAPSELLSRVFEHIGVTSNVTWSDFPLEKSVFKGPNQEIPERFKKHLHDLYPKSNKEAIKKIVKKYEL